ncbi:MAG: alpha-L-fucosidase [Armatimonadetes bacterium]|nr:alpha-L-fucosidase [Armatimonadota bacterium]
MSDEAIRGGRSQRVGAAQDPRLTWWRESRFGMFIHWGLYAVPAGFWKGQECDTIGEWIMHRFKIPIAEYQRLAEQFNPVRFNAAEWVAVAREAGQRYLVITAKHHDGFCLFRSRHTAYNVVDATPFGRDICAELADECQRQGIKLGFYYSQTQDWHHPGGAGNSWDYDEESKDFDGYLDTLVKPQLEELLTGYGPIGLIWFDTPLRITAEQSSRLLDHCRHLSPETLISGRLGNDLGDYASAGDNAILAGRVDMDWETPATINRTWGFKRQDHQWKPAEELLHKLIDIGSKGGNYLLNVGPTAEGLIPQPSIDRLQAMGAWLRVNGAALYGTVAGPLQDLGWARTTFKAGRDGAPDRLFLHVLYWPNDGLLRLPPPPAPISRAYLLADPSEALLPVAATGEELLIHGPSETPDPSATVVVLEC